MERLRGQRRGAKKIPPDHLYSSTLIRGIVKNQNPKRVCGRPVTSRIAPTASRSVSSADPHSWYPPPSGGVSRRQPVLPHPLSDQRSPEKSDIKPSALEFICKHCGMIAQKL